MAEVFCYKKCFQFLRRIIVQNRREFVLIGFTAFVGACTNSPTAPETNYVPIPGSTPAPTRQFSGTTTSSMSLGEVLRQANLNVETQTSGTGRRFVNLDGSRSDWNIRVGSSLYGIGSPTSPSIDMLNVLVPAGTTWEAVRA